MPHPHNRPHGGGHYPEHRSPNHHGHYAPGHFPEHPHHRVHGMVPEPPMHPHHNHHIPHPNRESYGYFPPYYPQGRQYGDGIDVLHDLNVQTQTMPKQAPANIQKPQQYNNTVIAAPPLTIPRELTQNPKAYKDLITSNVYFTNEKWQECLASHGITIDEQAKTVTIASRNAPMDLTYRLTDDELKALTSNSIKDYPEQKRLDVLNSVIGQDFKDKVTIDILNSKNTLSLSLNPGVLEELQQENQLNQQAEQVPLQSQQPPQTYDPNSPTVDGSMLNELDDRKGWYREGKHGRNVEVGEIRVDKDPDHADKFRMTAFINGQAITHEISQKQYNKFLAVDDYHRMKLFSDIFHEVDMKKAPHSKDYERDGVRSGMNFGAALFAGLTIAGDVLHGRHSHSFGRPEVYEEHHHGGPSRPTVYYKEGVDSPRDIASRAFDAGMNAERHGVGLGR